MHKSFILFILVSINLFAGEYMPDGGFELTSKTKTTEPGFVAYGDHFQFVSTSYGRSLRLAKSAASGITETKSTFKPAYCPQKRQRRDNQAYCTFELTLETGVQYELSFDYMPGCMNLKGEVTIDGGNGKKIYSKKLLVDNTDWNYLCIPFKADAEQTRITFFINRNDDMGEMLLDNLSVRKAGNVLPRWGAGNVIINNEYNTTGWPYCVKVLSGQARLKYDNKGFSIVSKGKATAEMSVVFPSVMPEKAYRLYLVAKTNKACTVEANIEMLDDQKKPVGKTVQFPLSLQSDKKNQAILDKSFQLPPDIVLVKLTVKISVNGPTKVEITAPFISVAH